jgi:hypothetical protein
MYPVSGCQGPLVRCSPDTLVQMPHQLSIEAASMPKVFMIAHMALEAAARMSSGKKVMGHAGAGWMVLAAVKALKLCGFISNCMS